MSYPRRLLLSVIALNLFVFGLAAVSIIDSHRQYRERAEITTRNLARVMENSLVNAIERVDVSLRALLDIHAIHHREHQHDAALMAGHIEKIRVRLPEVDAIRLTDAAGRLAFGDDVDPDAQVSLADRPHFVALRDNPALGLAVSRPQVSRANGKQVIVLARRIERPGGGGFDGMIFAAIALDALTRQFAALDLGPGGAVTLRDGEFRLIARHPDLSTVGLKTGDKYSSPELQELFDTGATSGTVSTRNGMGGKPYTVSMRKAGAYPFHVSVSLASEDYLADWRGEAFKLGVLALVFLFGSLHAARLQHRAWSRQQEAGAALARQEALYHELVENTPMLVVRYLPDTTITFANTAYAAYFDSTPAALQGKRWLEFIPDEADRAIVRDRLANLTPQQPVSAHGQHRVLGKDGQTYWTQWTDRAFFDATGAMTHLQSEGEDISERKRARDIRSARLRLMEFAAEHDMHALLVATLDEACALTESRIGFYHFLDADQKTLSLQAWSTRTAREYCKAEGEGRHYDIDEAGVWVDAVRERRPVIHNDYASLAHKRGLPPGHAELIREMVVPVFRKGLIVAILGVGNKAAPYTEDDLQAVALLADLAWDFAEAKRLEAELVEMATTDFLTGLFNRRNFMLRLDTELARLKRFDIERAAVLMLDLDHFKQVNDTHGHAVGDAVLRHCAALIRAELRKIDTGGRLGGEEFAILLIGADLVAAEQSAERLRRKIAATPLAHEGKTIPITISIGVTALDPLDASADLALTRADAALYDAKHRGRDRVCVRPRVAASAVSPEKT
jgi:diguanylate cyclase (GGDEF)-like protein/PAS domain S-box-containing protein